MFCPLMVEMSEVKIKMGCILISHPQGYGYIRESGKYKIGVTDFAVRKLQHRTLKKSGLPLVFLFFEKMW